MKEPDMSSLCNPHTVVARFLVEADAIADPKALSDYFGRQVEEFASLAPAVKEWLAYFDELKKASSDHAAFQRLYEEKLMWGAPRDLRLVVNKIANSFSVLKQSTGSLFLAILQQLAVPPNRVKKVQAAARFWAKSSMRFKLDLSSWVTQLGTQDQKYLAHLAAYSDLLSTYREHVALVADVVVSARPHGEEATPKLKAGPFTLVNTGNFPPKVMEDVRQTVEKAAAAMTRVGLGKVCYGDVMVTNTITSKSNVVAFYILAHDEMFVRANVKPSIDSVDTVCHELAHRLENKFLQSARGEIQALYRTINRHVGLGPPTEGWPEVGHAVEYKGDKLVVLNVNRYTNKIQFGEPPTAGKMSRTVYTAPSLEWWAKNIEGRELERGPDFNGFITPYAKSGGPSENFAEMVSYYAAGKLPSGLVELLEPILG